MPWGRCCACARDPHPRIPPSVRDALQMGGDKGRTYLDGAAATLVSGVDTALLLHTGQLLVVSSMASSSF